VYGQSVSQRIALMWLHDLYVRFTGKYTMIMIYKKNYFCMLTYIIPRMCKEQITLDCHWLIFHDRHQGKKAVDVLKHFAVFNQKPKVKLAVW